MENTPVLKDEINLVVWLQSLDRNINS